MIRQISLLTKIQLCNLFGLNQARFTKDKKKKATFIGMAFVWMLVICMLVFYVAMSAVGLAMLGVAEMIPLVLFAVTSLIILFFSFFKAASVIFQMSTYEMLVALPVSETAIVISRFLSMYLTDLLLSFVVMLPGTIIYGIFERPGFVFYVCSFLGVILLPLLPITLAVAIGAVITAISSRMKHKNLAASLLTVLFAIITILASTLLSTGATSITKEMMQNITLMMTEQMRKLYLPAIWFEEAVVDGRLSSFLLLAGTSIFIFSIIILLLKNNFMAICRALNATSAKNNYKMQSLSASSPLKALWKREIKRYFASSIYVSNTSIGYILMVILAGSLFFVGIEQVEEAMQMPGIAIRALPIVLSFTAIIMPSSSCSISMEGKQWWIAQTLPVSSKTVFDSKILMNLTIAAPFYVVAVVLTILAVEPTFLEGLWCVLIPAAYIFLMAVVGITVNLAMPIFDWDNDARVVKQSASTLVTMLTGFVVSMPVLGVLILFKDISVNWIMAGALVVLLLLTAILYQKNNKKILRDIA